jgi:predicted acyl esterase
MLGDGHPAHPRVGTASQEAFVCTSLQLAVHALAHRWTEADLGLAGQAEVPQCVMAANQRHEDTEWPLSRAMETDFHLRADGRLTPEPPYTADQPEEFTYDPFDPVPTTGGALLLSDEFPAVPLDQTAMVARKDVLVFNVNSTATAPDFALDGITLTVH